MRVLVLSILFAAVAIASAVPANLREEPLSLQDVDVQSHPNVGDRQARQFGHGVGYRSGYVRYGSYNGGGSYGGYPGLGYPGYGGYGAGYGGGYRGYGGYGGIGGYAPYGGYGGYNGGFYG